MRIIDAHIHTSFSEGRPEDDFARSIGVVNTYHGLLNEMKSNSVEKAIALTFNIKDRTPMDLGAINKMENENILFAAGINPLKLGKTGINSLRHLLVNNKIKAMKIYLGYFPFYPYDKRYKAVFGLAKEHECPVIFHTGDVFAEAVKNAKIKFSHPIHIDDVAADNPDVTFVMAHAGEPWVVDAAEVIYKNPNVYADLSGFIIGKDIRKSTHHRNATKMIDYVLNYVGNEKKFLYGSDWPLVPMKEYISFVKSCVPRKWHDNVFHENARRIFKL